MFVFFFQAEDGIRDADVTGVQTCALPIYPGVRGGLPGRRHHPARAELPFHPDHPLGGQRGDLAQRSEERRVGKECRSRRSPDQKKKKKEMRERKRIESWMK